MRACATLPRRAAALTRTGGDVAHRYLSSNQLSGTIPASLGSLTSLTKLSVVQGNGFCWSPFCSTSQGTKFCTTTLPSCPSPPPAPPAPPPAPPAPPPAGLVQPRLTAVQAAYITSAIGFLPAWVVLSLIVRKLRGGSDLSWLMIVIMVTNVIDLLTNVLVVMRSQFFSEMLLRACAIFVALPAVGYLVLVPFLFNWTRLLGCFFHCDASIGSDAFELDPRDDKAMKLWRLSTYALAWPAAPGLLLYDKVRATFLEGEYAEGTTCPKWARGLHTATIVIVAFLFMCVSWAFAAAVAAVTLVATVALTSAAIVLYVGPVGALLWSTELLAINDVGRAFMFYDDNAARYSSSVTGGSKLLDPMLLQSRIACHSLLQTLPQLVVQVVNSQQLSHAGVSRMTPLNLASIISSAIGCLSALVHVVGNCCEFGTDFEKWDGQMAAQERTTKRSKCESVEVFCCCCCSAFACCCADAGSTATLASPAGAAAAL